MSTGRTGRTGTVRDSESSQSGHRVALSRRDAVVTLGGIGLGVADPTPETFTVAVVSTPSAKTAGDPVRFGVDSHATYVGRQQSVRVA